jgi:hypothetical protein
MEALRLQPASREAVLQGCTCKEALSIDVDCPIHFPLYYMHLLEEFSNDLERRERNEKYYMFALMGFVVIDILLRINCLN